MWPGVVAASVAPPVLVPKRFSEKALEAALAADGAAPAAAAAPLPPGLLASPGLPAARDAPGVSLGTPLTSTSRLGG